MAAPKQFHAHNHFVPCVYLKGFESAQGLVSVYRLLVADGRVPEWKPQSPRAVAYHRHLYTRLIGGRERDDVERWLDAEFERPAESALGRVLADERMSHQDWERLFRFTFAQFVRTPASLHRRLPTWERDFPPMLRSALQGAVDRKGAAQATVFESNATASDLRNDLPLRLMVEQGEAHSEVKLTAEIALGRAMWINSICRALEDTMPKLTGLKWTVLRPHGDLTWFTSDDPVVPFKRFDDGKVIFHTGWGSPTTQILFPVGPRHLLYTQVGCKLPQRGHMLSLEETNFVRWIIALHASRSIFAFRPDQDVPKLRPRLVDRTLFNRERESWQKWPEEQAAIDRDYLSGADIIQN